MLTAIAASAQSDKPTAPNKPHARASAAATHRRVARHEAEVRHLQQDVAKQESASKQASERLQKQDQAIAELQKQLQKAHASPAAGKH
ncbi:MAG: hypothetical protein ABI870_01160 [Rhodanobacter sp.]